MKITNSTELMKNQKHATSMSPASQFEALQTQEGHALFFSIGDDGVFYLTRENPSGATGWDMQDLSTPLAAQLSLASVTAKCFDVTQDTKSSATDIVLVVTGSDGNDYLLVSLNNANTDAVWAANRTANTVAFSSVPFDDSHPTFNPSPLVISDVSLIQSGTTEYLIADVVTDPSSPVLPIFRYFVDPLKKQFKQCWNQHDISGNLSAGKVTSLLGRKNAQTMDGVYTMGQILNIAQLQYLPLYTITKVGSPSPTTFSIPAGATAMAVSVSHAPYTDLFVAANGSLTYLAYNNQISGNTPGIIYSHALLQGVKSLHVDNTATRTILWGLNENGQLFYMSCTPGSEGTSSAWSLPVAILAGVENVATYVHNSQNNLVIFAHLGDDNTLIQLTQDFTTSHWTQRSILLPSTDADDMIERYTFTTHVDLTDDNNVALTTAQVTITPTTSCTAYINDVYTVMYANVPLTVAGDILGEITIVQAIDSLAGVSFSITDGVMPTPVIVNPFNNILDKLNPNRDPNVQVSLDATVQDELGNKKQLVDTTQVSTADMQAMEAYITQFIQLASQNPPAVPTDGSQQPDPPATGTPNLQGAATTATGTGKIFGIQVIDGKLHYYDSVEKALELGVLKHVRRAAAAKAKANGNGSAATVAPAASAGLLGDDSEIEILAGDGWNWLKHEVENVIHFEIEHFGGINHFFFTIAEQVYHFALRASHDLANGIHFVLNKIKVAFEDMIKWLGSIFAWIDIINTHKVLYQYYLKFGRHIIGNMSTYQTDVQSFAATIKANINAWGDLPGDTQSSSQSGDTTGGQRNTPSSKWGTSQLKGNGSNASDPASGDDKTSLLQVLFDAADKEGDVICDAISQVHSVFANASNMSGGDIAKAIVAILADAVVDSAANVIEALIEVLIVLLTDAEDMMKETIKIPVISKVYKTFTGSDLSILDLACLLTAIPITVIYKLANGGDAPFTSDDVTAFENAADFDAIAAMAFGAVSPSMQVSPQAKMLLGADDGLPASQRRMHHILTFAGNIGALVGGTAMAIMGTIKALNPKLSDSKPMAWFTFAFYFPYIGPDILSHADLVVNQKQGWDVPWYVYMNSVLSAAGLGKALADGIMAKGVQPAAAVKALPAVPPALGAEPDPDPDPVPGPNGQPVADNVNDGPAPADQPPASIVQDDPDVVVEASTKKFDVPKVKKSYDFIGPILDAVINGLWEVPVAYGYFFTNQDLKDTNNILNFVGNSMFNISGLMSPVANWGVGPVKIAGLVIGVVCNAGYGAMLAATSLDSEGQHADDPPSTSNNSISTPVPALAAVITA
jgi:hypothetical protein